MMIKWICVFYTCEHACSLHVLIQMVQQPIYYMKINVRNRNHSLFVNSETFRVFFLVLSSSSKHINIVSIEFPTECEKILEKNLKRTGHSKTFLLILNMLKECAKNSAFKRREKEASKISS